MKKENITLLLHTATLVLNASFSFKMAEAAAYTGPGSDMCPYYAPFFGAIGSACAMVFTGMLHNVPWLWFGVAKGSIVPVALFVQ